jgi:3-isopropylmalate dehydrogenase
MWTPSFAPGYSTQPGKFQARRMGGCRPGNPPALAARPAAPPCQYRRGALAKPAANTGAQKKAARSIMATHHLLLLPGDGIGPEVMAEVKRVIAFFNNEGGDTFEYEEDLVGGSAYDAHGKAVSDATMKKALAADAVIFGAVGGPKWDGVPYDVRPEAGLLRLRKDLELFANLRPAIVYPALADASSLKRELVEDLNILIVRELTGGVYFGEPKTITDIGNGQKRGVDTQVYDTYEIERIARVAFDLARHRRNKVTSMEKHNVMKSGVLWREVVTATHAREYADVNLEHMLADAGAMQLVRAPKQFDVVVTDNLFGDILSDVAAQLTGSLGMLPSASLGLPDPRSGKRRALYEPVHGSAPDIAGKGIANPIAMLASFAMALRYSFGLGETADRLERAISGVLDKGLRTGDIWTAGHAKIGTTAMGDAILAELSQSA